MRKVIYTMSVSIDGFIEAANGDISWTNPGPDLYQHMIDRESSVDTHLYGRRLYENMTAYWPTADENPAASAVDIEYARIWKSKKKIVFSRTLTQASWGFQLFRGDIAEGIHKLKAQPGKDMFVGGPNLAATFMQLGLIDEYHLYVIPIILGSGKPMFSPLGHKINLKLLETRTFDSGVMLLRYANIGAA